MTFFDQLLPASFRGVPFHVLSAGRSSGRRLAKWEYIDEQLAELDDLGGKAPTLTVTGVVFGDDAIAQRDALEEALDTKGVGVLCHPTRGILDVRVDTVDTTEPGGDVFEFAITFEVAGPPVLPLISISAATSLGFSLDALMAAAKGAFLAVFDVRGAVSFVRSAIGTVRSVTGALRTAATAPTEYVTAVSGAIESGLDRIEGDLAAIIHAPEALADALVGLVRAFTDWDALAGLGAAVATLPPPATLEGARAATNHAAFVRLARTAAHARACQLAVEESYTSADDALRRRAETITQSAALSEGTLAETQALTLVRATTLADLTTRAATLPRLRRITPPRVMPALVLAHDLYGDATRVDELTARAGLYDPNHVRPEPFEVVL